MRRGRQTLPQLKSPRFAFPVFVHGTNCCTFRLIISNFCPQSPDQCLDTLLPPDRPLGNILRTRGHDSELPRCSLNLHKRSFIINCLFKFIDIWTCFRPTYVCIASCNLCIYVFYVQNKRLLTYLLTYLHLSEVLNFSSPLSGDAISSGVLVSKLIKIVWNRRYHLRYQASYRTYTTDIKYSRFSYTFFLLNKTAF